MTVALKKCIRPLLAVYERPDQQSRRTSELLYGESVEIPSQTQEADAFLRITTCRDRYSGYVECAGLVDSDLVPASHQIINRSSLLLAEPSVKSAVVQRLPLLSEITLLADGSTLELNAVDSGQGASQRELNASGSSADTRFVTTADGYYIFEQHLAVHGKTMSRDLASLAGQYFSGCPYVWGGKTPSGADCSGMIQMIARLAGKRLPRDSHEQEQHIEQQIEYKKRRRGDLVFWPGHVAVLEDAEHVIHANAHSMDCRPESLEAVVQRAGQPSSIRRLIASP